MTTADSLLKGSIDPHVHASPDVWPRLLDAVTLARDASDAGIGGFVLVNHFSETAGQAAIVDRIVEGTEVRGAVKLNHPIGGVNPAAVKVVLELGAAKVDMPTQQSENELAAKGDDPSNGVPVTDADGELREEVYKVIDLVAASEATLATGHLAPTEIETVIDAALDAGVERPVVSHPELPSIDMPVEIQTALAERGALMEYCYVSTTEVLHDHYDIEASLSATDLLEMAAAVGPEAAMLATDFGQPNNPAPSEGMTAFIENALAYGFDETEITRMVRDNAHETYGFS